MMDDEEPDKILYADCAPSCAYHIGGQELEVFFSTVYTLARDGMIEQYEQPQKWSNNGMFENRNLPTPLSHTALQSA